MPEHNPAAGTPELSTKPESSNKSRNLMLRVVSSAVLAPVAVGAVYLGGWTFAAFWTIAAIAVWWEWTRLVHPAGHLGALVTGASALLLQAFLLLHDRDDVAVMIAGLGALAAAIVAARHAFWMAAGVIYASILVIAPMMIRGRRRAAVFSQSSLCSLLCGRPTSLRISPAVRSAGRSLRRRSVRTKPGPARSAERLRLRLPVVASCSPRATRVARGRS